MEAFFAFWFPVWNFREAEFHNYALGEADTLLLFYTLSATLIKVRGCLKNFEPHDASQNKPLKKNTNLALHT